MNSYPSALQHVERIMDAVLILDGHPEIGRAIAGSSLRRIGISNGLFCCEVGARRYGVRARGKRLRSWVRIAGAWSGRAGGSAGGSAVIGARMSLLRMWWRSGREPTPRGMTRGRGPRAQFKV